MAARPPVALPRVVVAIPRTEVELGLLRQEHTYYVIEARAFGLVGSTRRPIEDFEALHAGLARKLRGTELPPLPCSSGWASAFFAERPELAEERRVQLETLLRELVRLPEALADGEEQLLRFLQLPKAAEAAVRLVAAPRGMRGIWLRNLLETTSLEAENSAASDCDGVDEARKASDSGECNAAALGVGSSFSDATTSAASGSAASVVLRAAAVEDALTELLCDAVDKEGRVLAGQARDGELALACALLERRFDGGHARAANAEAARSASAAAAAAFLDDDPFGVGSGDGLPADTADADKADEQQAPSPARRAELVRALLALAGRGGGGGSSGSHSREPDDADPTTADDAAIGRGGSDLVAAPVAAERAVLAVARGGGRQAWIATLAAVFAEEGGALLLAGGADGAGRMPARLAAELLLRGCCGGLAARRLAQPSLAVDRKRLLNWLFESDDAVVRTIVGLLLAQLVREDGFGDTARAHAGLDALRGELAAIDGGAEGGAPLRGTAVASLLFEEDMWVWLSRLATALHPAVSGFVLLVISRLVASTPWRVVQTPGLRDTLLAHASAQQADPEVRGLAAQLLLAAYCGGRSQATSFAAMAAAAADGRSPASASVAAASSPPPPLSSADVTDLGAAVVASVGGRLAKNDGEHGVLLATAQEARHWYDTASGLEPFLAQVRCTAEEVRLEGAAWAEHLEASASAVDLSDKACEASRALLDAQRERVGDCVHSLSEQEADAEFDSQAVADADGAAALASSDASGDADGGGGGLAGATAFQRLEAELRFRASEVEARERCLELEVETRLSLTRQLAERDEALRHSETALARADVNARQKMADAGVEDAAVLDSMNRRCGDSGGAAYRSSSLFAATLALEETAELRAQQQAMEQAIGAVRQEAMACDEQLRSISEPLPAWRASLAVQRDLVEGLQRRRTTALARWFGTFESQERCASGLRACGGELRAAGALLSSERARRRGLRGAVQALAQAASELDHHLAALERWDERALDATPLLQQDNG